MVAVVHTKPKRKRLMSPVCLLLVPWHCLAPLLTPQNKVTQPLSPAYSHTAYLLSIWCVVGCVLPRQSEDPLWRDLSLCGSRRYSNCIMVAACPVQSLSPIPHSNRVCVQGEDVVVGADHRHRQAHTPPCLAPTSALSGLLFFHSVCLILELAFSNCVHTN